MYKNLYCIIIALSFLLIHSTVSAQEFPIAVGSDSTFCTGAAFDGTNYLIGIQGDAVNSTNLTAQLISSEGSLVGSRIPLGQSGGMPLVSFDGTNYLMVWSNLEGSNVYGQFISTSGNLVGSAFSITTGASIDGRGGSIAFDGTNYMVVSKIDKIHYGQLVSKSGSLVGPAIKISLNPARDNDIAFDGNNYLVAWCDDNNKDLYGQLISKSGTLIGSNFLIDGNQLPSDNPVSIAFDGSRYLVCFHDQAGIGSHKWNLFGTFISTSGMVQEKITVRDSTNSPVFPMLAFDGTNYLITWAENFLDSNEQATKGMFFNTSGVPVGNEFILFDALNGKLPLLAPPFFEGNKYLVITTRVKLSLDGIDGQISFTAGDVYGRFINSSTTGINDYKSTLTPDEYSLFQNYPNPFNPATTINYSIPKAGNVSISVYNSIGSKVASLVNGFKPAGSYSVQFNANNLASGIYMYKMDSGNYSSTKKLIIIK